MNKKTRLTTLLLFIMAVCGWAEDWPGYYGPRRDGTSNEKGILRSWPAEGPKVLWTVPLGIGFGGPAVSKGKIYLLDRDEKIGDTLRCFDLADGKELWTFSYDAPGSFMFPGSRTTPTVDGDFVYICGPLGDLYCISTVTHMPLWHKNVWTDFGGGRVIPKGFPSGPSRGGRDGGPPSGSDTVPIWAITQNPLIYGKSLIVAAQTSQAGVVAYDKLTGELLWKTPGLSGGMAYVTPSLVKVGKEDHLVMMTASLGRGRNAGGGSVLGIDPLSGKTLWTYGNWQCGIPVPHAVDAGEGRALITGGYNAGSAMIKIDKQGEGNYQVTELFKTLEFGAHTQPPILYKNHFYVSYTTNERSDGLVCMNMDGQVRWKTGEEPAFNKGGAILADGVLLSVDGNTRLYAIDPDPSGFKPLASAELLEKGNNWAPLALSDGHLLVRDQKRLKCLKVIP